MRVAAQSCCLKRKVTAGAVLCCSEDAAVGLSESYACACGKGGDVRWGVGGGGGGANPQPVELVVLGAGLGHGLLGVQVLGLVVHLPRPQAMGAARSPALINRLLPAEVLHVRSALCGACCFQARISEDHR